MSSQTFLAIDLGAESGRGVLGTLDGSRVSLKEIGRFPTGARAITHADGTIRWDIENLFDEAEGLVALGRECTGGSLAGVGIDSWGVDFGLIDKLGRLLSPPVCYRDRSHNDAHTAMLRQISEEELWDATGIRGMPFNTLYQLAAIAKREPKLLEAADCLLLLPDLIANRLTGGEHRLVEVTNGSTTQMMTPGSGEWNTNLLKRAGLPSHILSPTVTPSIRVGTTAGNVPVYAPATHDTASAVAAVPVADDRAWAFVSSGTWSLLGCELRSPIVDRAAMLAGFSNERGTDGSTRFLKNIMGLWLVQECRKCLKLSEGRLYSYEELTALAAASPAGSLIDAVHGRFLSPTDMIAEIRRACIDSGQVEPQTVGEIIRCCLESLALAYRRSCRQMESILGRKLEVLYVIGGGSQNDLLNQWTANACGMTVYAGPGEATALGNILAQMIGAGLMADWSEARLISRASSTVREFLPDPAEHSRWAQREEKAIKLWH